MLAALVGVLASSPGLARLGVAGWAVAITAALVEPIWSVGAHLAPSTGEVLLTRVHSTFRAAVQDVGAGPRDLCK